MTTRAPIRRFAATIFSTILAVALPAAAQDEGPANAKGTSVDRTGKGY